VVHEVELPEDKRRCPECQQVQQAMGADVTHRLVYVPGHFEDHEYHRAKYACGTCKAGVTTAPAPAHVIDRSPADASLLAHLVVGKYADHCPLTRAQRIYTREGVILPVSTLADWVAGVAERILPLVDLLAARVLGAVVVRTDATGLQVLDPRSASHTVSGTMWCMVGDDRDVVFRYTPTGDGATGPWTFLAGRVGYLQADAASIFDRLFKGEVASAIEVGCHAHARRRFVALLATDCRAAYPIKLIARLYRIERLADTQQLTVEARTKLREERAPALLEKLHRWLRATHASEPPSSDMAKAVGYMLNQWEALGRFVHDGRLSLDNNLCERQLRDVAIGRRNYLFAGSHAAAHRAAALYSLLRTCAQHGVAPLPYVTDVLGKLSSGTYEGRLEELLPDRWQASSAAAPVK
jgi:transposase